MKLLRVALVSINPTVGAITSNLSLASKMAQNASLVQGANVVVFPEQTLGAYSGEDLVFWKGYVQAQWKALESFAEESKAWPSLFAMGLSVVRQGCIYNTAVLVYRGQIVGVVPKEKLPSYEIFYESRTFTSGQAGLYDEIPSHYGQGGHVPFGDLLFDTGECVVGLEVCEDIWSPEGPMRRRCLFGAELILNLSASPFRLGVQNTRRDLIATRSSDNQTAVVYCNLLGSNDGLIFDGGGFVAQNGHILHEAKRFEAGVSCVTVDLDRTKRLRQENSTFRSEMVAVQADECKGRRQKSKRISVDAFDLDKTKLVYHTPKYRSFFLPQKEKGDKPLTEFCEELLSALVLGISDYYKKTGAFSCIGVALSGGRDSLLCAILARKAIFSMFRDESQGNRQFLDSKVREMLFGFFMPSKYSSEETRRSAEKTAEELGFQLVIRSIDEELSLAQKEALAMLPEGQSLPNSVLQNAQSRIRAARMWNWSNTCHGLFLQTSNMSEKAVGYTTIGGDMSGALSPLANIPKTVVSELLAYLYQTEKLECIAMTQKIPPSAELSFGQEDEKDLMPYPVLDSIMALHIREKMQEEEIVEVLCHMFAEYTKNQLEVWVQKFVKLLGLNVFKWVQSPLSFHVGPLNLDRERGLQLPVVASKEW